MGNGPNPTSHSHKLEWILVIIGIAGLVIALLAWRKPVSTASEQSDISHPFTNVVGLSAPLINQGKTANPAQAQPGNSNQLAKLQEAELPQQIKPKEEEPATEKAADELHAYGATIGGSGAATAREKPKAQDSKAISQTFGDLNIVFESLRALDNQTILVNLIFQNKNGQKAIGVGVYREAPPMAMGGYVTSGPAIPIPVPLRSTLLGSDGLQFESDGANLVGIRPIRSNSQDLIEISPGQEIKTSFKYRTRDLFSAVSPSFRLQAEIVMKSNLSEPDGWVYPDKLPDNCKIHNLVLDIPVRDK